MNAHKVVASMQAHHGMSNPLRVAHSVQHRVRYFSHALTICEVVGIALV